MIALPWKSLLSALLLVSGIPRDALVSARPAVIHGGTDHRALGRLPEHGITVEKRAQGLTRSSVTLLESVPTAPPTPTVRLVEPPPKNAVESVYGPPHDAVVSVEAPPNDAVVSTTPSPMYSSSTAVATSNSSSSPTLTGTSTSPVHTQTSCSESTLMTSPSTTYASTSTTEDLVITQTLKITSIVSTITLELSTSSTGSITVPAGHIITTRPPPTTTSTSKPTSSSNHRITSKPSSALNITTVNPPQVNSSTVGPSTTIESTPDSSNTNPIFTMNPSSLIANPSTLHSSVYLHYTYHFSSSNLPSTSTTHTIPVPTFIDNQGQVDFSGLVSYVLGNDQPSPTRTGQGGGNTAPQPVMTDNVDSACNGCGRVVRNGGNGADGIVISNTGKALTRSMFRVVVSVCVVVLVML